MNRGWQEFEYTLCRFTKMQKGLILNPVQEKAFLKNPCELYFCQPGLSHCRREMWRDTRSMSGQWKTGGWTEVSEL